MLKCFDYSCPTCGMVCRDVVMPAEQTTMACTDPNCNGVMVRSWEMGRGNRVIGDECDVTIKHGLCNEDGSPRRFTSKAEMARETAKRGLVNYVEHKGSKGSDKSKHTTRWI
jgi:hypothetical protein